MRVTKSGYVISAKLYRKQWVIMIRGRKGDISARFKVPVLDPNDKKFKKRVKKVTAKLQEQYEEVTEEIVEKAIIESCNINKVRSPKYLRS